MSKPSDDEHADHPNGAGAALEDVRMSTEVDQAAAGDAPDRPARPRASRRAAAKEIGVFGAIPEDCTEWGIKRQTRSGLWEPLSFGDEGVERHSWPLAELSNETIRSRWGAGTYKTQWWRPAPGGGRKFLCQGTPVTYSDPVRAPAPAAAAPDPVAAHVAFMRMVHDEAEAKIHSTLELARALTGGGAQQSQGISATDLLAVMREERAAAAEALRVALETQAQATQAAVAALEAKIEALSDDEDVTDKAAAMAAAMGKKKGGFLGFLAGVAEHRELIKDALPLVIGALSTVNETLKTTQVAAQVSAQQRAQARPQAQPRPTVVDAELVETELEREQREAYERATAPIPRAPASSSSPATSPAT